jgi:hypothetical protein
VFANLREMPFIGDASYPKGGSWIYFVQTGILTRPGIILMVFGGTLYGAAKVLPKKYWETSDSLLDKEIREGIKKKEGIDSYLRHSYTNMKIRDKKEQDVVE